MHPIVIVGGIMAIVILLFLFVPSILGATSLSGGNLTKYNGTSDQGNNTARAAGVLDTYLVGLTGIPLEIFMFLVAIACVVVIVLWVGRGH